jgi:succinoglycan biosynthesis transport protein ExoP
MTATAPSYSADAIDITRAGVTAFLKAIRKHWAMVAAATLLAGGGALLYAKSQPRIYQANVTIEIDPHATLPLGDKTSGAFDLGAGSVWDAREYYETQYKILVSDRVLSMVVRDLSLTLDYDFLGMHGPSEIPVTLEAATDALRSRVSVEPVKYSRLALVKVDDPNPKRAARLANAVTQIYIDQNLESAVSATSDAVVWLNGQVDHVKRDLEENENSLHDFKEKNRLPSTSINEASNMLRVELQALDEAVTHTRTRRAELAAREAELSKISATDPDELPASELLTSSFLQSARSQYQTALKERNSLLAEGKGDNHPSVKTADERVTECRAALLGEIRNIQGAVARDLAIIVRQEQSEEALYDATRQRAVDLNMKEIEYHRLDRSRDQNEKLFSLLLERTKDADLARMMRVNNARIIDLAHEPKIPIRPKVSMITAIGTGLGLLLGVLAAWTREKLDTSLKTPDDVEAHLGVPFLGLLPASNDQDKNVYSRYSRRKRRQQRASLAPNSANPPELVVHYLPLSGVAEAARSIRTNLLFMNPDKPYRKLLVSSAGPSEGKTTVACSIAIALAQGGQRVCIVDCDLRRPRLHRIFNRIGDIGLVHHLVGDVQLDDVAKPTGIENLWAITSGPTPPNPADVLNSERFRRFLSDLGERFDRVVIDSPPLVAVTDGTILSTLVDGTVFVVRAFSTNKHLAAQGLRALRGVDSAVVGTILNAVNLDKHEYAHYYHYYYYKRAGYGPTPPSRDDDSSGEESASPN